jgi:Kef-type K+ transport system membrane component KefB
MPDLDFGVLFLLGMAALGGMLGASFFQRLRIPQVVGYIAIGILIGQSGLNIVSHDDIIALRPFNLFALGLIGFLVGGELRAETLRRYKKQFSSILIGEGMGAFFLVSTASVLVVWYFAGDIVSALAAGIIFGAIASATDPASTIDVLWEYRARGAVTTTITAIVALDDALAMTLYGIGTSAALIITGGSASIGYTAALVSIELGGAVMMGVLMALLLNYILRWMYDKENAIAVALGTILVTIGISGAVHTDTILATMTFGVILINIAPRRSKELFSVIKSFSHPIYVLFFVLVGARLEINDMPPWLWLLITLYVLFRCLGKMAGASLGAMLAGAPRAVSRYGGLGLFAQGGIAVGLSIMASQRLGDVSVTAQMSIGDLIIFAVTATTLIVQLLGPPMTKLAIKLAGEIDKNVTEEDIIAEWKVKNVMDREALVLKEHDPLSRAVQFFSEHENMSYPVVDRDGGILGIITLERLKNVLADHDTWNWLVASDVMIPVAERVDPSTPLKEALDLMSQLKFECIPVVQSAKDDRAAGMLEARRAKWLVSLEVFRRRKRLPVS